MRQWFVPCSVKDNAFIRLAQSNEGYFINRRGISKGDYVFVYISRPYSCILYKTIVINANLPITDIPVEHKIVYDNVSFIKVQVLKRYKRGLLSKDKLMSNGLGQVLNQQAIGDLTNSFISLVDDNKG